MNPVHEVLNHVACLPTGPPPAPTCRPACAARETRSSARPHRGSVPLPFTRRAADIRPTWSRIFTPEPVAAPPLLLEYLHPRTKWYHQLLCTGETMPSNHLSKSCCFFLLCCKFQQIQLVQKELKIAFKLPTANICF